MLQKAFESIRRDIITLFKMSLNLIKKKKLLTMYNCYDKINLKLYFYNINVGFSYTKAFNW